MTAPNDLADLDRQKYVRLTTFKRDGTAVHTPVWFAVDGTSLLVWTDGRSGKVKRLRNDPRVEVVASDARGRPKGEVRTGRGRRVDDDATHRRGHDLLNRKYGFAKRGWGVATELTRIVRRRTKGDDAILEITLDPRPV